MLTKHRQEGCDLGPSPRGATLDLKTDIQAAGLLSLIDWSMPRPTRACRSFQRERRTTGFIQRPGHCFRLQRPGATGRQMVHPKVHTGVLVLGLSGLASCVCGVWSGAPACRVPRRPGGSPSVISSCSKFSSAPGSQVAQASLTPSKSPSIRRPVIKPVDSA